MKLFTRPSQAVPTRRQPERPGVVLSEDTATFRRGRTLTGSASSLVRSTNESQADLKSSRVQTHELLRKRRRIGGLLIIVMIVSVFLYLVISQFTAQAKVQASPDPSLRLSALYSDAIDDYFSDHLGERLRIFTDTDRLTRHMQTVAPEVKEVNVEGGAGFGTSLFTLTFREPIASWSINDQELYVDADGVPFAKNYFRAPTLRITDQSGMASVAGESVMSNRFMGYIGQVIGFAKENDFTVTSITIPEGSTRQVDVRLEGVEYPFKFSSERSAGQGVNDMVKVITWMRNRQITPEYVDVRVDGKVFYK